MLSELIVLAMHCKFLFHYLFVEGVTKIGVEKFEVMEEDEVDELSSATGPQRCKFFS